MDKWQHYYGPDWSYWPKEPPYQHCFAGHGWITNRTRQSKEHSKQSIQGESKPDNLKVWNASTITGVKQGRLHIPDSYYSPERYY